MVQMCPVKAVQRAEAGLPGPGTSNLLLCHGKEITAEFTVDYMCSYIHKRKKGL